jgi:multidrug efflux pump subunit AcrB
MSFIEFAVRRWQITLVVFGLLTALGLGSLLSIPRSVDPHFPIPVVVIIAVQPGADPADMEQTVAKPIEDVLQGLDNIEDISSRSSDGISIVFADFDWGSDTEKNYDGVVREVNAIRSQLPSSLARIEFRKVRTTETAIVQLALVSETASVRRMEKIAKDLRDRVNTVDGVRLARSWGIAKPEIRVSLDSGKLAQIGLPVTAVTDALRAGGADLPAGAIHSGDQRFNVEAGGAYRTIAEVAATPVRAENGRLVRVGDVADVDWSTEEVGYITRYNGKRAIWVTATQKDGLNVLDIEEGIMKAVDAFRLTLPPDVKLELAFDQSQDIRRKLAQLGRDFAIALFLVLLTLLPLGPRASLVVMVSIPLSLAMGVLAMQLLGFTLNQLAITGFIVALGLLVDDSIVVTENIARHLRMGKTRMQAALDGTRQIAVAVVGCTATLLFAFLPLVFLPEGAGMFTRSLPLAVLVTVAASLFVSLTIVPFLASRFLPQTETEHGSPLLQAVQGGIHRFYAPVLHWSLTHPRRALIGATLLCVSALGLVPIIGSSLFPDAQTPYFVVEVESPKGASIAVTDRAVRFADAELAKEPAIIGRMSNTGATNPQIFYNVRSDNANPSIGNILVTLDEFDTRETPAMIERLRAKFDAYSDARIIVRVFQNGPPVDAPIAIFVQGPEIPVLKDIAAELEAAMVATPGTRDIANSLAVDRIDLDLGLDDAEAALLGVPAGAARRAVRLALAGEAAGKFRDAEGDSYDVIVRLPMGERAMMSALDSIYLPSTSGAAVPLSQVAEPRLESAPATINRYQRQRSFAVTSYVQPGYLNSEVSQQILAKMEAIKLPAGYSFFIGGEARASANSFGGLGPYILLAVFGILGVLVLEFGRFRETAVVAGVIPLGMFGGIVALFLTGNSISYTAVIGFVALIGIEIKNSILLVDFTTQLRQEGRELRDAIEEAGEVRFLPVLLTSVTAIGGLMPLAVANSSLYSPLAWVIIGGLISSTLLSRVVTPVMYLLLVRNAPVLER